MKGLNWKGIALAIVMQKIFSYATGYVLSFIGAFKIRSLGLNPKDTINYVNHVPQVYLWSVIISSCFSVLCGYIAAGTDRKHALTNALVMSLLFMIISFLTQSASVSITPLWFRGLAPIAAIIGALLGGYIRSGRPNRKDRVLDAPQSPLPEVPRR